MLQVKSCNVNHNSESVFRYFASAVNSNYSTKCNRKDLYAICSYPSFKKVGYVFFFFFFLKVGYVPLYTFRNRCWIYSDWAFEITLHSSSARRDSPCADSPDRESGFT